MSALTRRFPEIARYAMSEARSQRLLLAAGTTAILGGSILVMDLAGGQGGSLLYPFAFGIETLILLIYGGVRATGAVVTERIERTWDIQRLTPLGSFEMAVGKLVGAPIFAYYLAALMLPWVLTGAAMWSTLPLSEVFWHQAMLLSLAFLVVSTGLLASAFGVELTSGSSAGAAGGLVGFIAAQTLLQLLLPHRGQSPLWVDYLGLRWPGWPFFTLSALALGAWAFAGAKWRIGQELLEPARMWRLPAFLGFLVLYQVGFKDVDLGLTAIVPAVFAFFAAVLHGEGRDHWRRWLARGGDRWGDVPVWLNAAVSYACLAVVLTVVGPVSGRGHADLWGRYPLLQACFLVRDFAFLQLCRFSKSRRPEIMAIILLALAYGLPPLVLVSFQAQGGYSAFAPVIEQGRGWFMNLLPALAQAGLLLCLLGRFLKKLTPLGR
jgi:hypothetical protein